MIYLLVPTVWYYFPATMGKMENVAATTGLTNSQLILLVSATAVLMLATHYITGLHHDRQVRNAHFPQPPVSSVWGHLKEVDKFFRKREPDRHADYVFTDICDALGRPPLILLDLRPINASVCLVGSHEVAEQISKASKLFPWSPIKYPQTIAPLHHMIGDGSILLREGLEWKALRKQFNPGFAPQHLATLLPRLVDKVAEFVDVIDRVVRGEAPVALASLTGNLAFDIIGAVVLDLDTHAQNQESPTSQQRHLTAPHQGKELQSLYSRLVTSYDVDSGQYLPWWLIPLTKLKREYLARKVDKILKELVRQKFSLMQQEQQQQETSKAKTHEILSLSLSEAASENLLTPQVLQDTADQLKTFLFAGWDTTGVVLAWTFYELSRSPKALAAVRAELDQLFGPETASNPILVCDRLRSLEGESLIQKMPYITAVFKETLRLYPPASTGRTSPPGTGFTVTSSDNPGQEYCLDGMLIYICARAVQRDPAVYGETADEFVPERWLNSSDIPPGAWRPFERGPRNCIGQELAMIEGRVLLAVVARTYDFVKVGLGELALDPDSGLPVLDDNGRQWKVRSELYNTRKVTAKPVDGMMMKVRLRSSSSMKG
ncbi:hypothetical protein QBC37DRAFT_432288 [Rhypophila decipiens]|uniref:Cytochrome P450 n=1 Tax=Rhypophila decipiens TaxID=261697 RepID=A0AAN7B352_9PEZI|nr:hypothetical protein QBC37DRAFT_432288 [Rhypophila decipiens]